MTGPIRIFSAGFSDIGRLCTLAQSGDWGSECDSAYFSRCLEERSVFIALSNGEDAGYVMLNERPRYQPFRRLGIPEFQDLYVSPLYRRCGLGAALLAHCEQVARERGYESLGLGVGLHSGFGSAQRLYVRLGYVPDGQGIVYDREHVTPFSSHPVDDHLCLMMLRDL